MDFITTNITDITAIATAVVTIASIVANWTKTTADNTAVGWFSKLINLLALNFSKK